MSIFYLLFCTIALAEGKGSATSKDEAKFYQLKQGNLTLKFSDLGARVVSLSFPDKQGKLTDVVPGHDTIQEYKKDVHNFNAIVGRYTNIIKGANFTMNGKNYKLTPNHGNNTFNGGHKGYGFVKWKMQRQQNLKSLSYIIFTYNSLDGEEGFPGNLTVMVKYTITHNKLITLLHAKTENKDTPVNLGQHMGFNLAGFNNGNNILSHEIHIFGSNYIQTDHNLIATGKILPVDGTPYDYLKPHVIRNRIKNLKQGYHANYILDGGASDLKLAAILHEKKTGRIVRVLTTQPTILFTTMNSMNVKGKGGYVYKSHAGCTIDPQGYPDSLHYPNFPTEIVRIGKPYTHRSIFMFSVRY